MRMKVYMLGELEPALQTVDTDPFIFKVSLAGRRLEATPGLFDRLLRVNMMRRIVGMRNHIEAGELGLMLPGNLNGNVEARLASRAIINMHQNIFETHHLTPFAEPLLFLA